MKKQRFITPLLFAALLSGCSLIPDYNRPQMDVPGGWREGDTTSPTAIAKDWWKNFNSDELNTLMSEALNNNNDLGAAISRVEQARAVVRSTSATLLPSVEGDASGGYQRTNPAEGRNSSGTGGSVGLTVGYELDLFGMNRAEITAAESDLESFTYNKDALALVVMSDVAKGYFNVLNQQERLEIADKNLQSSRELLRIVNARFDAGATTLLDVAQQKSDLATTEASRALTEQQLKVAKSALAVLVGKPPQALEISGKDLRGIPVPTISPNQPSNLLEQRPDIRAAEADLVTANADIGAARAAFFPQVTLGADIGATVLSFGDPATTTASLLGSLVAPIFKGGLLEGNLDRTKARQAELVQNYRKAVLVSFKDVEDALVGVKTAESREKSLETAMVEARKAYDLSKQQYDVGSIDFQVLLDSQQTMLFAEDNYIQTKNDRLAATVDLYKALGGGWNQTAKPVAQNDAPMVTPVATPATVEQPAVQEVSRPVLQQTPAPTVTTTPATTAPPTRAPRPLRNPAPLDTPPQTTTE